MHNLGQCRLSWLVCARLGKAASRIVGFIQISRSWKDFAVRNGKFVLTVNSKHHIRVPNRASYYSVNNAVQSRNHAISVTLNLSAERIIWPACKPVHILYKRLHSRVRSQSALIRQGVEHFRYDYRQTNLVARHLSLGLEQATFTRSISIFLLCSLFCFSFPLLCSFRLHLWFPLRFSFRFSFVPPSCWRCLGFAFASFHLSIRFLVASDKFNCCSLKSFFCFRFSSRFASISAFLYSYCSLLFFPPLFSLSIGGFFHDGEVEMKGSTCFAW